MFTSNWVEKNANDYDELISAINKGDEKSVESILKKCSMSGWEANPLYAALSCNNKNIRQMMCDHYRKFDRYSTIVLEKIINDWSNFSAKEKQVYETIIYELTSNNDLIGGNTNGSILAQACESGNIAIVKVLIKQGVNLNVVDKKSKLVPLHLAILKNRTAVIDELIKAGANVNMSDKDGNRPLHLASESGNLHIVQALLRHGASLDCKNYSLKYNPLHIALEKGHFDVFEELMKAGADGNAPTKDGKRPIHFASELGNLNIVEMLLANGANPDWKMMVSHYTPLFFAVKNGHLDIVRRLLKAETDVNALAMDGKTPLYVALEFDMIDIVNVLIDHSANVHIRENATKSTLLHTAASHDNNSVAEKLVAMGVDIHARDVSGKTPLHVAALHGTDALESLLSLGADEYLADYNGRLPFHEAMEHNVEAMNILFDVDVIRQTYGFHDFLDHILKKCNCPSYCTVKATDPINRMLMHLTKFEAINVPICDNVKLKRHKIMNENYYVKCLAEAQQLRFFFLNDGCVSLYDYLHMKPKCRLAYVQSIPSELAQFEQYGGLIEDYTNEAVERKSLFYSAREALYKLTDVLVPDVCVERILDFLNLRSLQNLSNASIRTGE